MTTRNTSPTHDAAELTELRAAVSQLHCRCEQAESGYRRATRRARIQAGLAFAALVGAILLSPGSRTAMAQSYGMTLQQVTNRLIAAENNITQLQTRATTLENKTRFMTTDAIAKTTTFSACNVKINNGLGSTIGLPSDPFNTTTPVVNGLGNLIIGYNEPLPGYTQTLTGSHNLVLGNGNNYTSCGGIVAGQLNTISAPFALIACGQLNIASGPFASVAGGTGNAASGNAASITGGNYNSATGSYSVVNGGQANTASATFASILGGGLNKATGIGATIAGGIANTASGYLSSVGGGSNTTESTDYGWVAGSLHSP